MSSTPAPPDPLRTVQIGIAEELSVVAQELKPRLRGWLHAGVAPLVLVAGIVLVVLAPTTASRLAVIVYSLCAFSLFASSAAYHRLRWSDVARARMKRLDHANIYLMIAGTYTPIALLGLTGDQARFMIVFVWIGAAFGVFFRVVWIHAPRALYTGLYIVLGWSVIFFIGSLFSIAGVAVSVLTIVGGACYTLGAVAYATKRPNPSPQWFGFHEVFHLFTILAWTSQYVAVSLLLYRA